MALSPDVTLHSVPARHFSNRGLCDRDKNLWTGYVLTGPGGPVYFAGDTGWGMHFRQIRERFGPMRLALLPIGAYLPRWFMAPIHISPAEAVRAHRVLDARVSIAIHFGTFQLGHDGQYRAVRDLRRAMRRRRVSKDRFWVMWFGQGRNVPPLSR